LASLGDELAGVRERMKAGRDKPDACRGIAGFAENGCRTLEAIKPTETAPAGH
jgi:hypothetical protein